MNNVIMSVVLLAIWLRLRAERRRNDTERNIEYLSMRAELHERLSQANATADSALSLQSSRAATIIRKNAEIAVLKRQMANLRGQITKLKKKIGGVK